MRISVSSTALAALSIASLTSLAGCKNGRASAAIESCTPGETLIVGCAPACGIGTACEGFPSIKLCDGALGIGGCLETDDASMFQSLSSGCDFSCPRGRVVCPPSGSIVVAPSASRDERCDWAVEHRGILPPGGRAAEVVTCVPGTLQRVACAADCGLGECTIGASLQVCEGSVDAATCREGAASLSSARLDCVCPGRLVVCPPSGSMMVAPITTGEGICEWEVAPTTTRPDATVTCDPGARLFVGCSESCENGSCSGEPAIRVCDGNTPPAACAADDAEPLADDGGGACSPDDDCPEVVLTCPGSGAITVVTRHYWGSTSPYACDWSVRVGGIGD